MRRWLLLLAGVFGLVLARQACAAPLELSATERAWIAGHGPVRVVVVKGAEPFYIVRDDGHAPQGFAIDLLALAAERAGLALQYRAVDAIADATQAFISGDADLSPVAAPNAARRRFASFPGALLQVQLVLIARRDTGDLSSAQDFAGRTLGLVTASAPGEMITAAFPNARTAFYKNSTELAIAVSQGQADLGVAWQHDAVYAIEANLLSNLRVHRLRNIESSYYGPVVSLRQPQLHNILAKALASLTPAERAAAARRWLPAGTATLWAPEQVALTPAERDWVQRAGELRVGYDATFAPFTMSGGPGTLGGFDGLGAETLRLVAEKAGLRIVQQAGASFDEVYQRALGGELNVIVAMARTEPRRESFEFVGPFATAPTVMVMRHDDPRRWRDPDDIEGGKLGLLKTHFLIPRLHSRRPGLPLVEFDSSGAELDALLRGDVDAVIGNGIVLGRLIEQRFPGQLRVAGVVPDGDSELFFGVPRANAELARVLQKGFDALTPSETSALERHWLMVSVRPGIHVVDVLRWVGPIGVGVLIVVITLLLANRRLQRAAVAEKQARAAAEEANAARGRFLAYLSHELRGTVGGIGSGLQLLGDAEDAGLRRRFADAARTSCDGLMQLLETTLSHERTMLTGVSLEPGELDLADWWARSVAPLALAAEAKGLVFSAEGPPAGQRVKADGARLGQILANLGGNAIKFTPSGGVALTARWDGEHGRLQLEVRDTGPGVPAAERERLFEPYAQGVAGRQAGVGAGLGLAITQQIVRAMGGTIEATAAPGGGALFRVDVPLEKLS